MSMLNDFKKLIFGAKSVSKSAKDKVEDKAEEIIDTGRDKLNDATDLLSDKFEDLKENTWDTSAELGRKVKDKGNEILDDLTSSETVDRLKSTGEDLLGKSKDALANAHDKMSDLTDSAVEKSDNAWDKIISVSDDVTGKVWEKGGELADKAKEAGARIEKSLDQTLEDFKAKEEMHKAKEREMDANGDGYADKPIDFGGSTLSGTDDFFAKAEKFAKGESINDPNKIRVGDIDITTNDVSKDKIDDSAKLAGFDDHDGDGDELVDDAIIIEDEDDDPEV